MGKTKHSKIALRVPSDCVTAKERKDYQDNEKPKNKPGKLFYKYGVSNVGWEDHVIGHQSNGRAKRLFSGILRKKIKQETGKLLNEE